MFIKVDPSNDVPIFRQIVQQIKTAVAMGRLEPEDPLPSVRQLAVELAVNPNTVARAYLDLEIEGVIYKRQGAGTFVSGRGVEMSKNERRRVLRELLEKALVEGLNLGMEEKELRETFERVLEKMMQARTPETVGR
ncbi:MAG: GntR family transcriptional regulator [Acidobacteriota bacterium]|nr:GntR family transcriptional regulator [Acidobacteriota bacterium]MDT7809240.1 GntR family transcriptional regulator [Acidobacteriota bacterium]